MRIGRRKPYTQIGIRRLKCRRCEKRPAVHQWSICALGNIWVPLCLPCDVALNASTLRFFGVGNRKALVAAYRRKAALSA